MPGPRPVLSARTLADWLRWTVIVSAALAVVSLSLEFGFHEPPLPLGVLVAAQVWAVVAYLGARAYQVAIAADRWAALLANKLDVFLLAAASVILLVELETTGRSVLKAGALYVGVLQAVLVVRVTIEAVRLNLMLSQSRLHPTRSLAVTFGVLIVAGTLLLALPKSTRRDLHEQPGFSVPRHVLNCAFTATSATCVTGLVVYDTGTDFTLFGQVVILVLIQAGGLGIMIFGGVFGLLIGRNLSLKQSLALQDAISYQTLGEIRGVVVFILVSTLLIEAVGACLLYPMWHGPLSVADRVFMSVFHAVSAFCNAGFALQSDSLIAYRRSFSVYGSIMPLIVLGGLGFPVLRDLWRAASVRVRSLWSRWRGVALGEVGVLRHRLSLHSRLVLVTSAALIVLPTLCFAVFEAFAVGADPIPVASGSATTMASAAAGGRLLDAMFYSVTCRTAGFNTVAMDANSLTPASHFLGAILMFVGGSPSSTAGGIKTIALCVMLLSVWATLRGRADVEVFGRTIPEAVVRRAAVVILVMCALISVVSITLCLTERVTLRVSLFETVSACGTVGLSMGLTPHLTVVGRVVIMLAMFAGRLGPLTLLVALAGRSHAVRYEYPKEEVGIG